MTLDLGELADAYSDLATHHLLPPLRLEQWSIFGGTMSQAEAMKLLRALPMLDGWVFLQREKPLVFRLTHAAASPVELHPSDRILAAQVAVSDELSLDMQQLGADGVSWWCTGLASALMPEPLSLTARTEPETRAVLVSEARHASTLPGMALRIAVAWQVHAPEEIPENAAALTSGPAVAESSKKNKDKAPPKPPVWQSAILAGVCEPWGSRMIGFVAVDGNSR